MSIILGFRAYRLIGFKGISIILVFRTKVYGISII